MKGRLNLLVKIGPIDAAILSKHVEPVLDFQREGVGVQAEECRGEGFKEAQALGELVAGAPGVVSTGVMKSHSNLDDGLIEVAKGVWGGAPEVFQGLVAIPVEA